MQEFDIYLDGRVVGTAYVNREGLYYKFRCSCMFGEKGIYKLIVRCGQQKESLGICLPQGESFGLEKRVPVKRLGEGTMQFTAVSQNAGSPERFVPLQEETPFEWISKLKKARFEIREGIMGLVISD